MPDEVKLPSDDDIKRHAAAAQEQLEVIKEAKISFTPKNEYAKSAINTQFAEFKKAAEKKFDELKLSPETKAEFKAIFDNFEQGAKVQFDKWKGAIDAKNVQAEWKTIVAPMQQAMDDKFNELKTADAKNQEKLEAARVEANNKLDTFNKKALNDQMYELNRSFQSQASIQLTQAMQQEARGEERKQEPPRTWFLITDAKEKAKLLEEDEKKKDKDHPSHELKSEGDNTLADGIYASKETDVKVMIQGGYFRPIPPPSIGSDSEYRESYREVLRYMRDQCGMERISFDTKYVNLRQLEIFVAEAKALNMSVRFGPEIMSAMAGMSKASWVAGITDKVGDYLKEQGAKVVTKLNESAVGRTFVTIGKGIGAVLGFTAGKVCHYLGIEFHPRADQVIKAVQDCEANYVMHAEERHKPTADKKIADSVLNRVNADPALGVLTATKLDSSASEADVTARLEQLKEARVVLNSKLQSYIENEVLVGEGNTQLDALSDRYTEATAQLNAQIQQLGEHDVIKNATDDLKTAYETEVSQAAEMTAKAADYPKEIGDAILAAKAKKQAKLESKESVFELPTQDDSKAKGKSNEEASTPDGSATPRRPGK